MAGNTPSLIMSTEKGFTLLELLVVVGIIATLSSIVLGGYRAGEDKFALQRSANKLSQDLRRAENMAMMGNPAPVNFGEIFPSGGYGFYFDVATSTGAAGYYTFFCDCNNNVEYESGGASVSCASSTVATPFPESMEVLSLETGVVISAVSPSTAFSITFFPPDPIIKITGADSQAYDEATITLDLFGKTKTITINTVGLIDID
ncbi:MAG: pilus assembly FimT family protein [Candidatus Heimdallarchaeaceae archaeon]